LRHSLTPQITYDFVNPMIIAPWNTDIKAQIYGGTWIITNENIDQIIIKYLNNE
jgi:hypothetical protein